MVQKNRMLTLLLFTLLSVFLFAGCGDNPAADETNGAVESKESAGAPKADELSGILKVSFLDVGLGDSAYIELPDGKTMLIDAGQTESWPSVSKYIRETGHDRIDYVVATHPHYDHIGGMAGVIRAFEIGSVYMPDVSDNTAEYKDFMGAVRDRGCKVITAKAGVNILTDGNLSADIIAPVKNSYGDLNNYSAVIKLKYGNTSFLFMGDALTESEKQITADINADVLKVGHHGSAYASGASFLDKVSPAYAVISVGDNGYGFPSEKTVKTLSSAGAVIYRTDRDGTVVFTSDGDEISVDKVPSGKGN